MLLPNWRRADGGASRRILITMPFAKEPSIRRRLHAWWHRGMTLVVCVSLLHWPVPVLHRHDEIESAGVLASHLATCHSQTHGRCPFGTSAECICERPGFHEPHWHFVMPSQRGGNGAPEHGIPHAEAECFAIADVSANSVSASGGSAFEYVCFNAVACSMELAEAEHCADRLRSRYAHAAVADQIYRCALSCVMRC